MPSEGLFEMAGLRNIVSVTIPRHHGITPDLIEIEIGPQPGDMPRVADITLQYDGKRMVMPTNLVDSAYFSFDEQGNLISLKVWDFRWKWRYNTNLVGRYNIRLPDGPVDRLDPLTEKSMTDLLKKCLDKLYLPKGYKIKGKVPDLKPSVYWNYASPARELQNLCDQIGFRIVPQINGEVWLLPLSTGDDGTTFAKMPPGLPTESDNSTVDPPETPDKLVYLCGSSRFQFSLPMEAVADDIDGLVKPIDEVSYVPSFSDSVGWHKGDINFMQHVPLVAGGDVSKWYNLPSPRQLALGSVFRKYRVRVLDENGNPFVLQAGGYGGGGTDNGGSKSIYIPGCPVTVTDIRQILPIGEELLEPVKTENGWYKNIPIIIWGCFARGVANNISIPDDTSYDYIPPMKYRARDARTGVLYDRQDTTVLQPEDYSIDPTTGIVTINGPTNGRIFRYRQDFTREPARLWMRATCQVMDWGTWVPVRKTIEQDPPAQAGQKIGAGKQYVEDSELFLRTVPKYGADQISLESISDNMDVIKKEAKKRLDREFLKLQTLKPAQAHVDGWYPVNLNGGIHEIVYTLNQGGAKMHIGLHNEYFVMNLNYEQRRFYEKAADERTDPKKRAILDMIREKDMPFSRASGITRSSR